MGPLGDAVTETIREMTPPAVGDVQTFMIADLRGYTHFTAEHGDEAAAALAARFAGVARDVVEAHGGTVVELRGDEALAVFTSPRSALRAALELEARVSREPIAGPETPMRVGIGLDAGEAVPIEGGFRGGALNLASRLCTLAGPGEILVSEGVVHLARKVEGLEYIERGSAELKGFDDPVRVVEVRPADAERAASRRPLVELEGTTGRDLPIGGYLGSLPANPVVGREAELARAGELMDAVMSGTGHLLLLAGEPGAGKTRLAQEITVGLRNRDFLIAAGRCYEPQAAIPFYPFIEALTGLYAAAPAEMRREAPRRWPELGRLLPALGLPVADHAGPQDQQRLFWTISGFVGALAGRRPLAILLDDLHWADGASLDLLQHLARHTGGARVLLLGTYRDVEVNRRHPLEAALRDLRREGLVQRIDVRRLSREETRELIAAIMGETEISDEFTELIHRRTEGNAFFVQQVLHAMVERGDVFRWDGGWDRKSIEEIEVPESVRSVVGQRLSRLDDVTQEILREASVLGQTFRFDELATMSGRSEQELERALDEAAAAGMVRETDRDGYGFDHALTQGALCAELSSRRRRRLHLAAGEAIEALPERKREDRAAELAWHFLEGDDPPRALRWSMAAGDGAEHVFAHSDAEYHYRTALQLAAEEGDRGSEIEASAKLGRALSRMARYEEALEAHERAAEGFRAAGDRESEIRATASIGWVLFEQGRRDEGIARLQPMLEAWQRDPGPSPAAASLHAALANLYWHAGRLEEGLRLAEQASALARIAGDDGLLGVAEGRRGVILELMGHADDALEAYTGAIPLLEAAGDLETLVRTLNNRSLILAARGQHDLAWVDLERALDAARRLSDPVQIGWALGVLAMARWSVEGDWQRVRPYVDEIARLERLLRGTRSSGFIAHALCLRFFVEGDESALARLRLAAEEGATGDLQLWQTSQEILARLDLLQGRADEARARLESVFEHPGIESQHRASVVRELARASIACGDLSRAEALLASGIDERQRTAHGWSEWLLALAELHDAQGRWEEARLEFEEALQLARVRGYELISALIALSYGEVLARRGDGAAREQLMGARAGFRRLRAGPFLEAAERALAALS